MKDRIEPKPNSRNWWWIPPISVGVIIGLATFYTLNPPLGKLLERGVEDALQDFDPRPVHR